MTIPALLFAASSLVGWLMFCAERAHRLRELRRQSAEHRQALASYGCHRFAQGLNLDKQRRRDALDWKEAVRP